MFNLKQVMKKKHLKIFYNKKYLMSCLMILFLDKRFLLIIFRVTLNYLKVKKRFLENDLKCFLCKFKSLLKKKKDYFFLKKKR